MCELYEIHMNSKGLKPEKNRKIQGTDSNDIREYTPDYKPTVGMFDFSYATVM